jgi:hypothetical protein
MLQTQCSPWFACRLGAALILLIIAAAVRQVKLDAGIQKYVLLRLSDTRSDTTKLLVWGATAAAYHNHVLQVGG